MTTESPPSIAALRRQCAPAQAAVERFALGDPAVDGRLSGGLARGRLHEVLPAAEDDGPSALGFALMLALRATDGPIVWIGQLRLHPPGLAELGADPARILFVDADDELQLLRAGADALRSPAAGVAVLAYAAPAKRLDLTASRRLTLAAEASGVTAIVLKAAGDEAPSSAATRWRIATAPSVALEADAPGGPCFHAELLRHRGGAAHPPWRLEWDRDRACFGPAARPEALPGDLPAVPALPRVGRAGGQG